MRADEPPEVARAQVEHPVGQLELLEHRLGPPQDVGLRVERALGRGVGEQLHLVELVHPQQAAGVAPGRARLAPVARRRGGEAQRQLRLLQDLAAVHRGQRHLGRRDQPQVVALDVVGVVGELRQVARSTSWSRSARRWAGGSPRRPASGGRWRRRSARAATAPPGPGRAGTSSPPAAPRAPCRGSAGPRRSPSAAPAGARAVRARAARGPARATSGGPPRCPPRPARPARRRPGCWGGRAARCAPRPTSPSASAAADPLLLARARGSAR